MCLCDIVVNNTDTGGLQEQLTTECCGAMHDDINLEELMSRLPRLRSLMDEVLRTKCPASVT